MKNKTIAQLKSDIPALKASRIHWEENVEALKTGCYRIQELATALYV